MFHIISIFSSSSGLSFYFTNPRSPISLFSWSKLKVNSPSFIFTDGLSIMIRSVASSKSFLSLLLISTFELSDIVGLLVILTALFIFSYFSFRYSASEYSCKKCLLGCESSWIEGRFEDTKSNLRDSLLVLHLPSTLNEAADIYLRCVCTLWEDWDIE